MITLTVEDIKNMEEREFILFCKKTKVNEEWKHQDAEFKMELRLAHIQGRSFGGF